MRTAVRIAVLFTLPLGLSFGRTWSGSLVDAKCYAAEERNVNPTDTETFVDRDQMYEIHYCVPKAKTKSFAVVQSDGQSVDLTPETAFKAANLVQKVGKKHRYLVVVTGELVGKAVRVDSIQEVPQP